MSSLIFNLVFGLIPTMAFAWSLAADRQKDESERVVITDVDERRHNIVFALVYGLWSATLAMWNWMRGMPTGWSVFWLIAAGIAFVLWRRLGRKRTIEGSSASEPGE